MSEIFLKAVNMSISASWLVLVVLLLRLILKKAPKWVNVLLWGIVAVRLICPISIESVLSLIPSAETVSPEIMMDWTPEISTGIDSFDAVVNPIITESFAPQPMASANPLQIWIPVSANFWLLGIGIMLIYTAVSYLLLRRKVATAIRLEGNIYQSENVVSPFVLGIIKPKIYLPFRMDAGNLQHVIAHEQAHIRRKDHLWKPLGFLLLAIHWFNPLMWLGYVFLCRDIELACDEKVIGKMDSETKADYTQALVACSVNRRSIAACPLAFGEVDVKARVKSILHYKKPAFWVMIVAVLVCVIVAVCFLTDPKNQTESNGETVDYEVSTILACSGNQKVPLFSFPEGTTISQYKECVCWLTIDPRDEETVPFFLWHANEVIRGFYSAFDSETFEPLKHFIPSGLDPQTYLFQNADPTRSYIVLVTFSTEPDAKVYAFGARFPGSDQNNTDAKETFAGNLKTYHKNADGSWECDGYIYKYRLEIKPTAAHHDPFTFVYLSNLKSITFSQAYLASGVSSNLSDGFFPAEAMLVEWYSLIENGEPIKENLQPEVLDYAAIEGYVTPGSVRSGTPCRIRLTKQRTDPNSYYNLCIEVVSASKVWRKELEAATNPLAEGSLFSADIDGDQVQEILVHNDTGGHGGFGVYQVWVLKPENDDLRTLFYNDGEFDTGFESRFLEGYQLEVKNRFTGYKQIFDATVYKEYIDGSDRLPKGNINLDPFYVFQPTDIDDDGISEIMCKQYTNILDHADYTGSACSVLKFNQKSQSFEVVKAWFEINTEPDYDAAVRPEQITGIVKATLELPRRWDAPRTVTDPETLGKIERILRRSKVLESGANCLFTGRLTLTLASGETLILTMSEDNCATWLSEGVCYTYSLIIFDVSKNDELYDLFTAQ